MYRPEAGNRGQLVFNLSVDCALKHQRRDFIFFLNFPSFMKCARVLFNERVLTALRLFALFVNLHIYTFF
jgi:hypothetical protein